MPKHTQAAMMEGRLAHWYARQRTSEPQLILVRESARALTGGLPEGAAVLEVAPGPGYHAVEMARLGCDVTGLDLSHTFIAIAEAYARDAGVPLTLRHGDAAALPFPDASFALVVCQAAFKNFGEPVRALDEMFRVLRPGGTAVIQDMNHDASKADIAREVREMRLGAMDALFTTVALTALRRRAYSPADFTRLAGESAFTVAEVRPRGFTLELRLHKSPA